jgi:hypothetical protein
MLIDKISRRDGFLSRVKGKREEKTGVVKKERRESG